MKRIFTAILSCLLLITSVVPANLFTAQLFQGAVGLSADAAVTEDAVSLETDWSTDKNGNTRRPRCIC